MNADSFEDKPALTDSGSGGQPKTPGSSTNEKIVAESAKDSGKSSGTGISWLALLLSLAALSLSALLWWQGSRSGIAPENTGLVQLTALRSQLQDLAATVAALPAAKEAESIAAGDDAGPRLQALEIALSAEEGFRAESAAWSRSAQAALEDTQSRLAAMDERMRNLAARSAESSTELELDEIDYLLRLAPERLQLFGDTRAADRALALADQQVLAFDNPMFIGLRREIAAARQSLAGADVPDLLALGAEIDKLQALLASLAFKVSAGDLEPATGNAASPEDSLPWWDRLKRSLSGLITVRRIDDAELAMPALADQQSLRQRAWLEVEQARLAALRREQDVYQDSLARAAATINRWFDIGDPGVREALTLLEALQKRNVDPAMPDIGMPWTTLRSIRASGLSVTPVDSPVPALKGSEGSAGRTEAAADPEPQSATEPQADMENGGEPTFFRNGGEISEPGMEGDPDEDGLSANSLSENSSTWVQVR